MINKAKQAYKTNIPENAPKNYNKNDQLNLFEINLKLD